MSEILNVSGVYITYDDSVIIPSTAIVSVKVLEEVDPTSHELPLDVYDIVIKHNSAEIVENKKICIYKNEELLYKVVVKSVEQKARNVLKIQCESVLGLLDDCPFFAKLFKEEDTAITVIREIFNSVGIEFEIDNGVSDYELDGKMIEQTNCRDALRQLLFCMGATAVSKAGVIQIIERNKGKQHIISTERIQSIDLEKMPSANNIKLTSYNVESPSYGEDNFPDWQLVYSPEPEDVGKEVYIRTRKPILDYRTRGNPYPGTVGKAKLVESSLLKTKIDSTNAKWYIIPYEYFQKEIVAKDIIIGEVTKNISDILILNHETARNMLPFLFDFFCQKNQCEITLVEKKHVNGGKFVKYGDGSKYGTVKYGGKTKKEITYDDKIQLLDEIVFYKSDYGEIKGQVIKQIFYLSNGVTKKTLTLKF